jgi:hypothetical protein
MTIGKDSPLIKFNDGEPVDPQDFIALQNLLSQRAWELPGFDDMMAFERINMGPPYGPMLIYGVGTLPGNTQTSGVFTRGGGLLPSSSGLVSSLGGGLLGVWALPATYSGYPDTPALTSSVIRWAFLPNGSWAHTHTAAPSGQFRYDLVTCRVLEADTALTTRSFEDATTGALTSASINKQTNLMIDLDASTAITQGTAGGSPTLPAIPSGRRILYYVKVSDSAITEVHDCTIPAGKLIVGTSPAMLTGVYPSAVVAGGGSLQAHLAEDTFHLLPPGSLCGDPSVRLLGVALDAKLNTGDTVHLRKVSRCGLQAESSPDIDVTSSFTLDNAEHTVFLDLRGLPGGNGLGPLWGNGNYTKASAIGAADLTTLAIRIVAGGTTTTVYGTTWYGVRG